MGRASTVTGTVTSTSTPTGISIAPARRWLGAVLLGLIVLVAGAGLYLFMKIRPTAVMQLKERQLTTNSNENAVLDGRISPDGKYLAYTDVNGIHLKLIETGETQTISQPEALKILPSEWHLGTWFPDGTKFLANAYLTEVSSSMWVVSVMGGSPHEIRDNAFGWSISPDGSSIAFSTRVRPWGGADDIWVMHVNGEQAHKVDESGAQSVFYRVQWAPNSQRLVYIRDRQTPEGIESSVETRDLIGGAPSTIISQQGQSDLYWLPDGRMIVSRAELADQDTCNLWQIRVDPVTGRARGGAQKFTNFTGFCPSGLDATSDGKRLTFQKFLWQGNVYVADLGRNGVLLGAPVRLTLSDSQNVPVEWTADSKAILFDSNRNGQMQIFKQALQSDTAEIVDIGLANSTLFGQVYLLALSPDGTRMLIEVSKNPESLVVDIRSVPLSGGPSRPVLTANNGVDNIVRCAKSPSSLCVIAERSSSGKEIVFTAFDPLQGRRNELTRYATDPAAQYSWVLSPDGTRIAILNPPERRVHIIYLDGRLPDEIAVQNLDLGDALDWAADGKGLFVDNITQQGTALSYVDLQGNTHRIWEQRGIQRAGGILSTWGIASADGRHLAINGMNRSSNVWMMQNF